MKAQMTFDWFGRSDRPLDYVAMFTRLVDKATEKLAKRAERKAKADAKRHERALAKSAKVKPMTAKQDAALDKAAEARLEDDGAPMMKESTGGPSWSTLCFWKRYQGTATMDLSVLDAVPAVVEVLESEVGE